MGLLLTTLTIFVLSFSIFWMQDQKWYEAINSKISTSFNGSRNSGEKSIARDIVFELFPFKPDTLIFARLKSLNELFSSSLFLSNNLLIPLLAASLCGFAIVLLGGRQNTPSIDLLIL